MAVTITRTPWIDDDGSGTTGTVLNNAVKTALYNEIDGALAKVAQLAGGNAFTGNQAITGLLTVNGFGVHSFNASAAGEQAVRILNTVAGPTSFSALYLGNDVGPSQTILYGFSSSFTTGAYNYANGSTLIALGPGGLSLAAANGSGAMRFYSGGTAERMRISPTGEVLINQVAAGGSGRIELGADSSLGHRGIIVTGLAAANNVTVLQINNNVGGVAGLILQTSQSTVAYQTSSDARLKDDDGPATDLTALRGVVVHDFTWKADGIRDRGVFAQEAHDLFPRAIGKGTDDVTDDGTLTHPWMTDYSKFVADLIVGWQQHDAELTALRAELATLKGLN